MYKSVLVKVILLLELLLIFWGTSICDTKNGQQILTTVAFSEHDLSQSKNDTVYRFHPGTITIKGNASVSVNIPKNLFEDMKNGKVVIYDNLRDKEITSSDIDLDVSTVYTYQIAEEGTYSIYAIMGKDDQTDTLDLTEYVTVYNVNSGEEVKAIQRNKG